MGFRIFGFTTGRIPGSSKGKFRRERVYRGSEKLTVTKFSNERKSE